MSQTLREHDTRSVDRCFRSLLLIILGRYFALCCSFARVSGEIDHDGIDERGRDREVVA